jgi:hypothetical protein
VHPHVSAARARVAALSRPDAGDDARRTEAARDLNAAKLEAYIEKTLAAAPPLSDEQRTKLAELLKPAREHITAARLAQRLDGGAA